MLSCLPSRLWVILNASMAFVTSQRQGSLAELKCVLQAARRPCLQAEFAASNNSPHITAKPLSQLPTQYTKVEKLKS